MTASNKHNKRSGPHEPSEQEIRAACADFQKNWSAATRLRRSGAIDMGELRRWEAPVVKLPETSAVRQIIDSADRAY